MGVLCGLMVAGGGVVMMGGRTVLLVERVSVVDGLLDGGVVVADVSLGILRGVGLQMFLGVDLFCFLGVRAMVND